MCPIHRLAAHDNSVTSLQFDDTRVVSGGSDGRVKIWDLKTGHLVRELISQGDAVWRVAFEEEKCVALALRNGRTVMEVSQLEDEFVLTAGENANPQNRFGLFRRQRKCYMITRLVLDKDA
jgi:WD40 repeat protein